MSFITQNNNFDVLKLKNRKELEKRKKEIRFIRNICQVIVDSFVL